MYIDTIDMYGSIFSHGRYPRRSELLCTTVDSGFVPAQLEEPHAEQHAEYDCDFVSQQGPCKNKEAYHRIRMQWQMLTKYKNYIEKRRSQRLSHLRLGFSLIR